MTPGSPLVAMGAKLPYRVLVRLPERIAVPFMAHRTLAREDTADRMSFALDERLQVDAYWLRFANTSGPALSVFCDGEEMLRIDGLRGSPHLHYCVAQSLVRSGQDRVELSETSDAELIDRARFELEHNLDFALHLLRRRSVQRHTVDRNRLASVAADAHQHLVSLVNHHRQAETKGTS